MKQFDVLVIGAGVVGAMIARTLAKYELQIGVLEKENDVAMGASRANSAIVHAGFDAEPGSLKARFNVRGSEMMEECCRELNVKYKKNGSLVVAFKKDELGKLSELLERGEKNGVLGLKLLSREEVLEKEPALASSVEGALWAPTGAIVCPYDLTIAAMGNAMDNGAQLFLDSEVLSIEKNGDVWQVKTENDEFSSKIVINCAGVWADKISAMSGDSSFEIKPRRGEYLLFDKTDGNAVSSTVFTLPTKLGKGILITPTVDGNLLLGPTAEDILDKDNKETTAQGLDKVKTLAASELKVLPRNVITSFTGLRAVGSTGDFIINEKDGFINVAGIESPGLSASPAIAEYVAELAGGVLELRENKDFNPKREDMRFFSKLSDDEKNEVIKKNPLWGKIVCRCEQITEGEIVEAIRKNPGARSIDGIKRRTRATMGRCQGGFCTPRIIEILSDELGVSPEQITKNGKGSELVLYKRGE